MRLLNLTVASIATTFCVCAQGPKEQYTQIPPRTTPAEYQAQAKVGTLVLAAEFKGHSVPTAQGTPLQSEDFVAVEVAFFGPAEARATLSANDFSLRVNGKKAALSSQPAGLVVGSLKDPEWEPPAAPAKSKTSMSGGGGGKGDSNEPPAPVRIPPEIQHAMAQRTLKAALPEGDRALPQAGLLFFQYRGKTQGIRSLELIYSGGAGKATLALQP